MTTLMTNGQTNEGKSTGMNMSPRRILIVEDDPSTQLIFAAALRRIDKTIQFDWVTNAEQALKLMTQKHFDLIVADYQLETQTTGWDIWKLSEMISPPTPFILMSGISLSDFSKLTEDVPKPPLYLPKPFKVSECQLYIQALLNGEIYD